MDRNDREFIKRQAVDGASEMTKETHVDQNTDFAQGAHSSVGVGSDTDVATSASLADNDVEKFTHESYPKHEEHEETPEFEDEVEKFSIDHLTTPDVEDIVPGEAVERDPNYVPNPESSEER